MIKIRLTKANWLFLCLFLFGGLFSPYLYGEENTKAVIKSEQKAMPVKTDKTELEYSKEKSSPASPSQKVEKTNPVLSSSDESLFVSDADSEKEMEKVLQETMLSQAKAYYPMVRGIRLESNDESLVIELDYDQPDEASSLDITSELIKNQFRAIINVKSPLLQKKEDRHVDGDSELIESINLTPNVSLSANLGSDSKIFFIKQIEFEILRPVRWKIKQSPGKLRVEFRPYLAGDEDEIDGEKKDILFEAPVMDNLNQVLGTSYELERKYENEIFSNGETLLIDELNEKLPELKAIRRTAYDHGASEAAVIQDMKSRYPTFGSAQYWKKHLSGLITNTTHFMKTRRNATPFMLESPSLAIAYHRKGAANLKLGYNLAREFPFFPGNLMTAPMDGFLRHDFQSGLVYKTSGPWIYSLQNQFSVGTSENSGQANSKFGDRLTTYQNQTGLGGRYAFRRGYAKWGAGLSIQTEEKGIAEDITSNLSALWVRPLTKKLATKMEYSYKHIFLHTPHPIRDLNVHKARFGLDIKLRKNITLTPTWGVAFYDGESYYGWIGGLNYRHKLSARSQLGVDYSTDFTRRQVAAFGDESLKGTRPTVVLRDALIRNQNVTLSYMRTLTGRMSLILSGSYLRERQLETQKSDKFDSFKFTAALTRQMTKSWAVELKYMLGYLDAYQRNVTTDGVTKNNTGNTDHTVYLRMLRYLNAT